MRESLAWTHDGPPMPADAQTYWMSAKIPNDTVLLYGFSGGPADPYAALEEIAERARGCPDLTMRIEDGGRLTYPAWVHREVDRSLFVVHDTEDRTFQACLDEASALTADRLDPRVAAWRITCSPTSRAYPAR